MQLKHDTSYTRRV